MMIYDSTMSRYVGFGKQSSINSPATVTKYLDAIRFDMASEKPVLKRRSVSGREVNGYAPGKVTVKGEIEFYLNPKGVGEALLMTLGEVSSSQPDPTNAPSVYEHTFTPISVGAQPPTYTVELGADSVARRIVGAIGDSITVEAAPGEYASATLSILGVREESSTPATPSFPSSRDWTSHDASITLGGAEAELQALSLEVNNNPSDDHHVIGSRYLTRHELGELEVSGSMDIRFLDSQHLEDFLNDEETSMTISFTGDEIEGGLNYSLTIELPRIVYDSWSAEVSRSEMIVQSIDFVAVKPPDGSVVKFTLRNDEEGY